MIFVENSECKILITIYVITYLSLRYYIPIYRNDVLEINVLAKTGENE